LHDERGFHQGGVHVNRLLTYLSRVNLRHYAIGLGIGSLLTGVGAYFTQDVTRVLLAAATMFLLTGSFTSVSAWVAGQNDLDDGPGGSGAHV
jgi:hypothetical protein